VKLPRALLRRLPGGAGRTAASLGLLALLVAGAPAVGGSWTWARAQDSSALAPVPAYHGYVNDEAGVLSEPRTAQLESFLDQLNKKTGVQFAVLTVPSCAPEDPTQFKTRVFNTWGIGDKERRDGLLLLVSITERAVYFETGYGLEGTLPDGWQSRMLRDLAFPEFRAGRPEEGITAAVLSASQRIAAEKGVKLEWNGKELRYSGNRDKVPNWVIMLILFVLFFIVFPALASQSRYRRRRGWYSSGGWGGGFGGFGGGFGGGSFGSGGGGGGSFGGFGGGSSGGGGGGGRW
jgi:uncharacterized protein